VNVFDAHTHFFGREFFDFQTTLVSGVDAAAALDRIRAGGIDVPERDAAAHAARWTEELDRHSIKRASLFASVPQEMVTVGEIAAASHGRFVPFAMVNPQASATIERLYALQPRLRFRGMLLFPAMHDYSIQSPDVTATLEVARAHDMIVFVHCGRLRVGVRKLIGLDPDFPAERSRPRELAAVARAHRDVAFIVPHFGAGYFDEALDLAAACHNVYLDTAGSNGWADDASPPLTLPDVFRHAKDAVGTERILYGSDSGIFPRGYRADVLRAQMDAMTAAGYTNAEREAVLGGNLSRLLTR
jgi:predicted TIM-barrel fold metal-dependent hydrolase